ncbi:MAG: DNA-binding response regulator [Dyadobacter sp. 50-39]|uniref:LytR/AlgR family response regulator transcription factor n=1 Tax=Dyadobacter sp. 50-39 TaxID=1895756 RepID=UPI00095CDF23|nr:LytTR family DNA-binding domain-containing protein [Dyadobacter sp. 50-39]OJV15235.1 MAG: DNA-binding response regulator [Dyadobacter sp. 50-39]
MEPLRCIIVDDEEGAHRVIAHYLHDISFLTLCGSFYNALQAMDHCYSNPVDVIFLDINMPGLSGMEMLAAMSHPPLVVLTTAHSQYALDSYKYQVVDYLVKPIELPRFMAAVDKVLIRYRPVSPAGHGAGGRTAASDFLMLKVDGNILRVELEHILYVQSWGNYVRVYTTEATYLSPITTTEIENKLDKARFMRIHKSYIVALKKIQKITGGQVQLDKSVTLPIGNTYRRELIEVLQ